MREIRIHDTLSGTLKPLEPRRPGEVGIYTCGPTVYARIHVGNARPFVVFALLKRFLEREGLKVTLVENVTDVNDKIYAAADAAGVSSSELAEEMTRLYVEDTDALGLGRPDHEPSAVATMDGIIALIQALIDGGHAYASDGDVYFSVGSFPRYGRLSNRGRGDINQGEGDDAGRKRSPEDFALWKARKEGEDTAWEAPWGKGRPGWHIECSAMAESLLGVDFEIHGGGSDLVFPHHENEIAQTEAAHGRPLARIWMHNGMVQMGEAKMAKSAGNIHLLHRAIAEHGRDALVMYFVAGHYRQPLAFSGDVLDEAGRAVDRLRELCRRFDGDAAPDGVEGYVGRFFDALADDFNTPTARAVLFEWAAVANRRIDAGERLGSGGTDEMLHAIGLEGLLGGLKDEVDSRAARLLEERAAARADRDFARADAIRDELAALGWEARDTADGARLVPIR